MAPVIAIVLFVLEWMRRKRIPSGNYAPAIAGDDRHPAALARPGACASAAAPTRTTSSSNRPSAAPSRRGSTTRRRGSTSIHLPASLFPWFFLAVAAVIALWRTHRFLINWILAVLVPYSLMSSKLDVYMMAMIPPMALLIARVRDVGARTSRPLVNAISIAIMALIGIAGLFVTPQMIKGPEGALVQLPAVKIFCVITLVAAILAFVIALRSSLVTSTIAAGLVPIIAMIVIAIALMPVINDISSTRPLVAALEKQHVPPEQIALYAAPYLWTRDMPRGTSTSSTPRPTRWRR